MPVIIDDRPAEVDFIAYQGSIFPHTIIFSDETDPIDLSGHAIHMQIRKTIKTSPILALTTANGRVVLLPQDDEATKGWATLKITATDMADIPSGTYRYDLELVPPSGEDDTEVWLMGTFTVTSEVTRG